MRPVTFLVAANNAADATKASADYLCDGTNDEVEIQAAVDAAAALWGPGIIQLSEGRFDMSADVDLSALTGAWLRGAGVYGTYLNNGGLIVGDAAGLSITDLEVDGAIILRSANDLWVERVVCWAYVGFDPLDVGDPYDIHINDCTIDGGQTITGTSYSIAFGNGAYLWVTSCYLGNGVYGSPDDGTRIYGLTMEGNTVEGKVFINKPEYLTITGNSVSNNVSVKESFTNGAQTTITGNYMYFLLAQDSRFVNVTGNTFDAGIRLTDSSDCLLASNLMVQGSILLLGASDRNHLYGNTGHLFNPAGSPVRSYFIDIGASCNDNKVWGNDGFGTWSVAAVNDLGTGTDLTSANR